MWTSWQNGPVTFWTRCQVSLLPVRPSRGRQVSRVRLLKIRLWFEIPRHDPITPVTYLDICKPVQHDMWTIEIILLRTCIWMLRSVRQTLLLCLTVIGLFYRELNGDNGSHAVSPSNARWSIRYIAKYNAASPYQGRRYSKLTRALSL